MQDVDLDSIEVTEEDLMDDDLLAELQDVVGLSLYSVCVYHVWYGMDHVLCGMNHVGCV